jgi:diguanylate cyclase (GGDEF)-like protein/PAS domain S-box-containing protein
MEGRFYRELLDAIADGVYFVDKERRITFWNKGAERISGYAAEEVMGRSCADNILRHVDLSGTNLCLEGCPLGAVMRDGAMREVQVYLHHKLGHRVPVEVRATAMRGEDSEIRGAVEVFTSAARQLNVLEEIQKLRKEVITDPLTGIGNRRYAEIRLYECQGDQKDYGIPFGVLLADIDHFKAVNDRWGHEAGDKVLQMTARALSNGLRGMDAVCRWGGEEFLVVTRNIALEGLKELAERLRLLVEHSWLDWEGGRIAVTASFGGAVSREGESASDLLNRADVQLYGSKEGGRNRVSIDSLDRAG